MGYSIWLGFRGDSALRLQTAIAALSAAFSGPVFVPHLTLVGDLDLGLDEVQRLAGVFGGLAMPSHLPVRDVGLSARYFMALYLAVEIPGEVQRARERIARAANPSTYELDAPHVSLLYADAEPSALARHREALRGAFAGAELEVAGLDIVRSSKSLPVSDWRIVDRIELSPPAAGRSG